MSAKWTHTWATRWAPASTRTTGFTGTKTPNQELLCSRIAVILPCSPHPDTSSPCLKTALNLFLRVQEDPKNEGVLRFCGIQCVKGNEVLLFFSSVQSPKLCVTIRKKEMGVSLCLDCVCGGGTRALNWYLDLLWIVGWSQRERDETVWAFPCAETENRFPGLELSLGEKTEPWWTHTHTHMWKRTLSMKDLTKIDEDWSKMKD